MSVDRVPFSSLTPKEDTGAAEFLRRHPKFDGKGVIIAILDTGVDPGTAGLQVTPDGKQKIVDLIDATGSGDVCMKKSVTEEEELGKKFVRGISGRKLYLNPTWVNPSGKWRVGLKAGYDLYPKKLIRRISKLRQDENAESLAESLAIAMRQRAEITSNPTPGTVDADRLSELDARVSLLQNLIKSPIDDEDLGPMYDVIAWQDDKKKWRVALDTSGTGDFAGVVGFTNFRDEYQWGVLDPVSLLNYSINIYNDGDVVSIVTEAGTHGTHVASIAAAYFPDAPDTNGVAPGAQLVGIKIGDHRLGSMETGTGLQRGLRAIVESGAHIVNMSYGEYTSNSMYGEIMKQIDHLVLEEQRIFVSSAGNNGPAISTVGCPGGSHKWVMGIAAAVSAPMMDDQYSLRPRFTGPTSGQGDTANAGTPITSAITTATAPSASASTSGTPSDEVDYYHSEYNERSRDTCYTWSSRGPSALGNLGVSCAASGGASTYVPPWNLQKIELMNGTSMSSPNATGSIALLLSGLMQSNIPYTPATVRRAVENTATPVTNTPEHFSGGYGMIYVPGAWTHLVLNHILTVVKAGNLHPVLFQNYLTPSPSTSVPALTNGHAKAGVSGSNPAAQTAASPPKRSPIGPSGTATPSKSRLPSSQQQQHPAAPGAETPPRSPSLSEVSSYYLITPDDYVLTPAADLPPSANNAGGSGGNGSGVGGAPSGTFNAGASGTAGSVPGVSAVYPYRRPSAPSAPSSTGFSITRLLAQQLQPPIDVQVSDHGKTMYGKIMSGIYRREPGTTRAPFDAVVSFVPHFSTDTTSAQRLDFDYRLKLFSTDIRWVQVPSHATLNSNEKTISVHVNPMELEIGKIHFAQVQAYEMFTTSIGQKRLQVDSPLFTEFLHSKDLPEFLPAQLRKLQSESTESAEFSPVLSYFESHFPTTAIPAEITVNALAFMLGPLIRVPVTVIQSEETSPNLQKEYKYKFHPRKEEILPMERQLRAQNITLNANVLPTKAGTLFRRFLRIPTGATWMTIEVQRLNTLSQSLTPASSPSTSNAATSTTAAQDAFSHTENEVHARPSSGTETTISTMAEGQDVPSKIALLNTSSTATSPRNGDQSGRLMVLHAMQLVINETPKHTDWSTVNVYREGTSNSFPVPLHAGCEMVEVTLGQYWNSLGPALFMVTVTFHGVTSSLQKLTFAAADSPSVPVTLTPILHEVPIQPRGVLTTWHRTFDPVLPTPPDALGPKVLTDRDRHCDGSQQFELRTKYKLKLESKEKDATMILPVMKDMLYESAFGAYLVLVTNEQNRLVATYDMFPKPVTLPAGNLTVDVQIRAKDSGLLSKLISEPGALTLHLITPLKKDDQVQLRFSLSPPGTNAGTISPSAPFPLVQPVTVHIHRPSVPKNVNTGDILSGYVLWESYADLTHRMALSHADTPAQEVGRHPSGTPITYIVHAPDLKKKQKAPADESYLALGRSELEFLYEKAQMKAHDELVSAISKLNPFSADLNKRKPAKTLTVDGESVQLDNGPLKLTTNALSNVGITNSEASSSATSTDSTGSGVSSASTDTTTTNVCKDAPLNAEPTSEQAEAFEAFFRQVRSTFVKQLPLLRARLDSYYTAYESALNKYKSNIVDALLTHTAETNKKNKDSNSLGLAQVTSVGLGSNQPIGNSAPATLESLLPNVHKILCSHAKFVKAAASDLIAAVDQDQVAAYFGRVRNTDNLTPGTQEWHVHQERTEQNDALLYAFGKLATLQFSHLPLIPDLLGKYKERIPFIRPESPSTSGSNGAAFGTVHSTTSVPVQNANKWYEKMTKDQGLTLPLLPHNFFGWTSTQDLQKAEHAYSEWKRSKEKTLSDSIALELSLRKYMHASVVQTLNKVMSKNSLQKDPFAGLPEEKLASIRTAAFLFLQMPLIACRSNEHVTATYSQNNAFF